jgi:hypothetical protein
MQKNTKKEINLRKRSKSFHVNVTNALGSETNQTEPSRLIDRPEFHPLNEHRYFCPWISAFCEDPESYDSEKRQPPQNSTRCGWQLLVNAVFKKSSSPSSSPTFERVKNVLEITARLSPEKAKK